VNFLVDTNVVSEWTKPRPDRGVVAWLAEVDEDRVFISVVTLAELRFGIERLAPGARKTRLDNWLTLELPQRFESRVLAVDAQTANAWGRITARRQARGKPIGTADAYIAATAEQRDLTLVTRNHLDFSAAGIRVINPWKVS